MNAQQTALVLGLGESGRAAALLLAREGYDVTVADRAVSEAVQRRAAGLRSAGVRVLAGCRDLPAERVDLCVVSPGVRADSPWVRHARECSGELVSELELGARHCPWPIIGVTGSNGKSTLVKLCSEALRLAGLRAAPGGNYGTPLSALVTRGAPLDWVVAEVSSFQLEYVRRFRPRVGVLLNIQPDHLDRHGGMQAYRDLKLKLFGQMSGDDLAIVPHADPAAAAPAAGRSRRQSFGTSSAATFRYGNGHVTWGTQCRSVDFTGTVFANDVLGLAAAAAVAVACACGTNPQTVAAAARAFTPLPHRMNEVARIDGVRFVDDSKATNLSALRAALDMTHGPVHLIAGGLAKETDFDTLKESLAKHVRALYLIGAAAGDLQTAWRDTVPCRVCGTLDRAVRAARREAEDGSTVLLSPGCASFDQFQDFAHRGEEFVRSIEAIREEKEA